MAIACLYSSLATSASNLDIMLFIYVLYLIGTFGHKMPHEYLSILWLMQSWKLCGCVLRMICATCWLINELIKSIIWFSSLLTLTLVWLNVNFIGNFKFPFSFILVYRAVRNINKMYVTSNYMDYIGWICLLLVYRPWFGL